MVGTAAPALVALAVLGALTPGAAAGTSASHPGSADRSARCGALSVAAALVLVRPFVERHPVQWTGLSVPYVDLPFHLALSAQLAHRGPTEFAHVAGEPLAYHWATYAWVGHTSIAGTLALDVTFDCACFLSLLSWQVLPPSAGPPSGSPAASPGPLRQRFLSAS